MAFGVSIIGFPKTNPKLLCSSHVHFRQLQSLGITFAHESHVTIVIIDKKKLWTLHYQIDHIKLLFPLETPWVVDSSLETYMTCMGDYNINSLYTRVLYVKKIEYVLVVARLENALLYLYKASQFNVINASTTYTNIWILKLISLCYIYKSFGNYHCTPTMDGNVNWMKLH